MTDSLASNSTGTAIPFKVFGLQRTGTNLTTLLMRRNFRVRTIERWTEWKHGAVEQPERIWKGTPVKFLVCVRNPYGWLDSCYRYFQKAAGRDPTLPKQFLEDPAMSFECFLRTPTYEFQNPIDRWNRLNRHWLEQLPGNRTQIIRLEDHVEDQIKLLERLESRLNFQRRAGVLTRLDRRVDVVPGAPAKIDAEAMLDRAFMLSYSHRLLDFVNHRLNRELMGGLGYEIEETAIEERAFGDVRLTVQAGSKGIDDAQAAVSDSFDFVQINRWSTRIEKIVEFGAGLGANVALFKKHWPACRVMAYEPEGDNLRLLRLNARRNEGVLVVAASPLAQATLDFDRALHQFDNEIDVLRFTDPSLTYPVIWHAFRRAILNYARWIGGRLPVAPQERDAVMGCLEHTHSVTLRNTPAGECFLARRVRPPRIRAESAIARSDTLTEENAYDTALQVISRIPPYPARRFSGRGVVICGGGRKYFPCAWVCINMLRHIGVKLPIELWALNASELDDRMRALVKPLGVRCVDASRLRRRHPARILDGWELKPYAIIHSRFREVLFLDADNVAVTDPTVLFESAEYRETGAIFWPAYAPYAETASIWRILRIPYQEESDFETGQIVIDKSQCWKPLQLTMHLNENSDFYYRYTQGDKDTFHFAWRMLEQTYTMVATPVIKVEGAAWQHDFAGRRIFQHRYESKWSAFDSNPVIPDFDRENQCFQYLRELQRAFDHAPEVTRH